MVDPASIRNASFTLTPTGYNPEEVDRYLGELADDLGAADPGDVRNASFSLTPTGYNPEEVDEYLSQVADALAAGPVTLAVEEHFAATPAGDAPGQALGGQHQSEEQELVAQEIEPVAAEDHGYEFGPAPEVPVAVQFGCRHDRRPRINAAFPS